MVNLVNYIIYNKYLAFPSCYVVGYALNVTSIKINNFLAKKLKLPIDLLSGKDYEKFSRDLVNNDKKLADEAGVTLDRQLGAVLIDYNLMAIREEISYRFLLETVILPYIFPQFSIFSILRTCIASVVFSLRHLDNHGPLGVKTAQCFNTFFVGMVCSLAQKKLGLLSSILIHSGYNLHAFQYMYNEDLKSVSKKIRALKIRDVASHINSIFSLNYFTQDAISPFILIASSLYNVGDRALKIISNH